MRLDPVHEFSLLLHRIGRLTQFEAFKFRALLKGHHMDPLTAIFNFLSTPAGQKIVDALIALDQQIITVIGGLIKKVHDKTQDAPKA